MLIALGFPALEAIVITLIFNTTPVAFGALGVPITKNPCLVARLHSWDGRKERHTAS